MADFARADVLFFVQVGSRVWAVSRQGEWRELEPPFNVAELEQQAGLVVLDADALQYSESGIAVVVINDTPLALPSDLVTALKALPAVPASPDGTSDSLAAMPGQPSQDANSDPDQQGVNFGFTLFRQQHEKIVPRSGFNTEGDSLSDADTNDERQGDSNPLLPLVLGIQIEDGGDNFLNQAEIGTVTISGDAINGRDGDTLLLEIIDSAGNRLTFTVTIQNERWSIEGLDLSSLAEGPLTATISAPDYPGQVENASDDTIKDTLASISIEVDTGEDEYLDRAEQTAVDIFGTVENIQDGQTVWLTVTDEAGNSLTFEALVVDGQWRVEDADLSSLANGELAFQVQSQDVAGNPADAQTQAPKDSNARIFVWFVDGDQVINAAEQSAVDIRGLVLNVENGQPILVTLSDGQGNTKTLVTLVEGNFWHIDDIDLTGFADGQLFVNADTLDVAGNTAHGQNQISVDLIAKLTIDVITGSDDVINGIESRATDIRGRATDIEDGQQVLVTVTDANGTQLSFTTTVTAGQWQLDDVDLTTLADGKLDFSASAVDAAGNPATTSTSHWMDTKIGISIDVETGEDEYIDRAEQTAVDMAGTVSNIEDGQTVTISVTDNQGNSLSFTTTVVGGSWQLDDVDLSSLANGELTFTASATDVAGNQASASVVHEKDTNARIFVWVADNDHVINAAEQSSVTVRGVVLNVENGQPITVTLSDGMGKSLTVTTVVTGNLWTIPNLDLTGFADGTLYVTADVSDVAGNPAHGENSIPVDLYAGVQIDINAGSDDVINALESKTTDIFGNVSDIEDGRTVTVTVTDKNGASLTFTAVVSGGAYLIDDADISSLADGELNFSASVTDVAGNPATASTSNIKDSIALISIDVETGLDDYIDRAEQTAVDIAGTVTNIEDGQTVTLVITDKLGKSLTFTTTVVGGEWQLDDVDLSSLANGELTFSASSADVAGNPANASVVHEKDTSARIFVWVADNDHVINAAEQSHVTVQGVVLNVENGQTISVTLSDGMGNTLTLTTVVSGNLWTLPNLDLTGFADGMLYVTADVTDVAGNPAHAENSIPVDLYATITIDVAAGKDDVINGREAGVTDIFGTVTDIEDGRTVTVTVTDKNGATLTFTALVSGGEYRIEDADISALADGSLSFNASATDQAGNPATAATSNVKDSLASVSIQIFDGGDELISEGEVRSVSVGGTATNIEPGKGLLVLLVDSQGHRYLTSTQVQADGSWRIDGLDLNALGFAEGEVSAWVASADNAGNIGWAKDTSLIDTQISIDIDTGEGYGGSQLIFGMEDELKGTTTGVEAGQTVTLSISDGKETRTFTTLVQADGSWQFSGLDVAGMDKHAPWMVDVTVSDLAGNSAADALPTLYQPRDVIIYEAGLILYDSLATELSYQIPDGTLSISVNQLYLTGITSLGQDVLVTVAADGMSLTASRAGDGELVFSATLTGTNLKVQLFEPLDQTGRAATLFIQLEALQNDADGTSETIFTYAIVNVLDAPELTLPDFYVTEEQQDVSGSVFANDFSLEGLTLVAIEIEGTRYNVQPGTPLVVATRFGELTIDSKGVWHLQTAGDLDNQVQQLLDFRYYAVDSDGSKSASSAYIYINDGAVADIGQYRDSLIEPKVDTDLLESRDFVIVADSDALVADSLVFNPLTPFELEALGLKSEGVELSYSLSADGKLLTATAGTEVAFTLTLSASQSGRDLSASVLMDLKLPLDHPSTDILSLKLKLDATDTDGSPATGGNITIDLLDGADPELINNSRLEFDENDLFGTPLVQQGSFDIIAGSDSIKSLTFDDVRKMPRLTAGLEPLQFTVSADGTLLTAHTGDPANPVLEIRLLGGWNSGSDTLGHPYEITLYRAFDQNGGQISVPVVLKDFDGDSDKVLINFLVSDGTPGVATNVDLDVYELPNSNGGQNKDTDGIDVTASRDPIVDVSFDVSPGPMTDKDGNPLTQNGDALNWSLKDDGAVLEGRNSRGELVLSLSLPKDIHIDAGSNGSIAISAKLYGPIDQLQGDGSVNQLSLPITFLDSDGSVASSTVNLTIHDGLAAVIEGALTLSLNEQDLPKDGNQTVSGNFAIDAGSDNVQSLVLADGFSFNGYSSQGKAITLASSVDADGWYIATRTDGKEVFRLKLDADGTVTFEQSQPLDHPDPNGADVLDVNFSVQAVDADNDKSAPQTLTIAVTDAVPHAKDKVWNFFESDEPSELRLFNINQTGIDTGTLQKIIYKGVEYHAGDTIELFTDTGDRYGTLTVNQNGLATLVPELFTYNNVLFTEDLQFTIEDKDGDTDTGTLTLNARDSDGKVLILDPVFHEDTEGRLEIVAYPGDKDENEQVVAIKLDAASMAGGSLFIDGIQIFPAGGEYLFGAGALIIEPITGTATIRGTLTYLPADDLSDATDTINLLVTVVIDRNGVQSDVVTELPLSVISVADTPEWSTDSEFTYSLLEDAGTISLNLSASSKDETGADAQGSETLTFLISNISDGLTLTSGGKTITDGMIITPAELANLQATAAKDIAGKLTFDITPASTENDNGDAASGELKTVELDIKPVADKPSLETRDISSDEDKPIDVRDIVGGSLSDSSETLGFEFTLPDGWSIDAPSAVQISPGVWTVSGDDVNSGNAFVIPKEDVSSATFGTFALSVRSFSTEEIQDGIPPSDGILHPNPNYSAAQSVTIKLRGVANDAPTIDADPARWTMDETSGTISNLATLAEDVPIKLDFLLKTSDDDGSETLDLTLTGLPEGAKLLDASGNQVNLPVVDFVAGQPVYSVSAAQLATLSLLPIADFSGDINLTLNAQSTEKDGDSETFELTVALKVSPVIDETASSLQTTTEGLENRPAVIDIRPFLGMDNDGSETITGAIVMPNSVGVGLLLDGRPITIPAGGLDLATLTDASSPTLADLIASGRLAVLPPQDADGEFELPLRYEITDTSGNGETVSSWIDTTVRLIVDAQVNITTEIKATEPSLTSTDGSPIDITGQVKFFEADIDGSERLDYVEIVLPSGDGWYVEHPLGAIHDGNGRWLIEIPSLTSDTVREWGLDILQDVKIISDNAVTDAEITVNARVLDRDDGEIISTNFTVTFLQGAADSTATEVGDLQLTVADAIEDEAISFAGHLNPNITTDTNDVVSFRILASDLPEGGYFTGTDVEAVYNATGKAVIEWVFTTASLGNLTLHGISEHYAGDLSIPIRIIATDSLSGDTKIDDSQTLEAQIQPRADGAFFNVTNATMEEDTPVPLGIRLNFIDSDASPGTGGSETLVFGDAGQPIQLLLLDGGSLEDDSGLFQLKAGTTSTWLFTGSNMAELNDALANLRFVPPLHLSGVFGIAFNATAIDTALVGGATVTDTVAVSTTLNVVVTPVTDASNLPGTTVEILGDEDTLISLSGLDAAGAGLIDQDGSEVIYLTVSGVPAGSVLYYQDSGGNLIQLPNAGPDGGSFNGKPTYAWSIEPEQLGGLVLLPPENFSGDIPLKVGTVTWEQGTEDYVNNGTDVIVGVRPIADGIQIIVPPEKHYSAEEDDVIQVNFKAETLDVTGQELVRVTVIITSAGSLEGLEGVTVAGSFVSFTESGGVYTATLDVAATSVNGMQLHPGPLAFGTLNAEVRIESIDSNTVLGSDITDISAAEVLNFDIELTPEVDPPVWTAVDDVLANDPSNLLLGLGLSLQNPAPGETGKLEITGLPAGMTLEGASQSGDKWIADISDVASLKVVGANDGDSFTLTLKPSASLSGETAKGTTETITVTVDITAPIMAPIMASSFSAFADNGFTDGSFDDAFYWGADNLEFRFDPMLWRGSELLLQPRFTLADSVNPVTVQPGTVDEPSPIKITQPTLYRYLGSQWSTELDDNKATAGDEGSLISLDNGDRMPQILTPDSPMIKPWLDLHLEANISELEAAVTAPVIPQIQTASFTTPAVLATLQDLGSISLAGDLRQDVTPYKPLPVPEPDPDYLASLSNLIQQSIDKGNSLEGGFIAGMDTGTEVISGALDGTEQLTRLMEEQQLTGQHR
ncbi:adhesin [Shewanella khirikhana]|uniref:T1SS-143 repeat domain-containing protein n=1 Tax=Shewanella khirikhana TaxID=1965282 RepID=UPI0030CE1C98